MMRNLRGISFLLLLVGVLAACSQKNDGANVKAKLAAATKAGNSVMMVVTKNDVPVDSIMAIVQDANKSIKNNVVLLMNIDDTSNVAMVEEYMLTRARMPLVLLFSNKGTILGGMTKKQVSKEALIETMPTPKFNEIISAVSQGKSIFTIVSKKDFVDRQEVLATCKAAQKELPTSVEIVEIDIDDQNEANLLKLLNIDKKNLNEVITIVFNPKGETTGHFNGLPEQSELVAAAKKLVSHDYDHEHGEDCNH